jgi:hypothetical protein
MYDIIVTKGKINDFVIPSTGIVVVKNGKKEVYTKERIFNYIAIPVKNGLSQAQLDERELYSNKSNLINNYLKILLGQGVNKTTPIRPVFRVKPAGAANKAKTGGDGNAKIVLNLTTN